MLVAWCVVDGRGEGGKMEGGIPFGDTLCVVPLDRRVHFAILNIRSGILSVFHCVVHYERRRTWEGRDN